MKKIVSTLLVCVLLLGCTLALVSCGGPSGTYKDALTGLTTYEFSGSDVTITLGNWSITGEFEVAEDDEGKQTITFTFGEDQDGAKSYSGEHTYAEGEENGQEYIKIDGLKYNKIG